MFKALLLSNDKFILIPTLISISSILFILLNFVVILAVLPERIPLFYSRPWGEGQLAHRWEFLILPASLAVVALINLLISSQLHPSQKILQRSLLLTTVLIDFMILVTAIKILLIFV